jgi:superfamily II DNA or RNA helicase
VLISVDTARQLLDFRSGTSSIEEVARGQLEGAVALHDILQQKRVAYLADAVGIGKAYVALGAMALFRHYDPGFRVLFVAPRENIQQKWIKELGNFVRKVPRGGGCC